MRAYTKREAIESLPTTPPDEVIKFINNILKNRYNGAGINIEMQDINRHWSILYPIPNKGLIVINYYKQAGWDVRYCSDQREGDYLHFR